MPRVAISYRREDSQAITGRIRDHLANRYGKSAVFMDIDSLTYGTDYTSEIKQVLDRSDVLLSIVGPNWMGSSKGRRPRIQDPEDLVRIEVETALKNGTPVIPVLVGDASIPNPEDLPATLKQFDKLNAAKIDAGVNFQHDVDRLIRAIDDKTKSKTGKISLASFPWRYAVYVLAALLLGRLFVLEYSVRSGSLSKIDEFFSCGARILYPAISFREEMRPISVTPYEVRVLAHVDREAVVRLYSSHAIENETLSELLDKFAKGTMVGFRVTRDDFGVLTGWRPMSPGSTNQEEFYYRVQFTANKQFLVLYEMAHPPKDQSNHPYWNVNEILSRTLLPKGILSDSPNSCDFRRKFDI